MFPLVWMMMMFGVMYASGQDLPRGHLREDPIRLLLGNRPLDKGAFMLIPLVVAAALGIVVYRDALTFERRGIRLGNAPAALWGVGAFAFTGIIGVMYLVLRYRALRTTRSCPSCDRFARRSDQSCPSCGCPLHVESDRLTEEGQPRVADGS